MTSLLIETSLVESTRPSALSIASTESGGSTPRSPIASIFAESTAQLKLEISSLEKALKRAEGRLVVAERAGEGLRLRLESRTTDVTSLKKELAALKGDDQEISDLQYEIVRDQGLVITAQDAVIGTKGGKIESLLLQMKEMEKMHAQQSAEMAQKLAAQNSANEKLTQQAHYLKIALDTERSTTVTLGIQTGAQGLEIAGLQKKIAEFKASIAKMIEVRKPKEEPAKVEADPALLKAKLTITIPEDQEAVDDAQFVKELDELEKELDAELKIAPEASAPPKPDYVSCYPNLAE